jgi:small GTP-binding protein
LAALRKKVCILGAFAVGKTSLVSRFVKGIYSEKYLTTVGVKVDQKSIKIDDTDLSLAVWDLAGEDEFQKVKVSYLIGANGYLLVADGTRSETIETAKQLYQRASDAIGDVPFVLVINKTDLVSAWDVDDRTIDELTARGWRVILSSAKTGAGVDDAFTFLARALVGEK